MIRSDKMRRVTRAEYDWFWAVQKLVIESDHQLFPKMWKYFDAGLSPFQACVAFQNDLKRK